MENLQSIGNKKDSKTGVAIRTVNLITKMPKENKGNSIYFVDDFFDDKVAADVAFIKAHLDVLRRVDRVVEFFDGPMPSVETPFGVCDISKISTGCKCILCAYYLLEKIDTENLVLNSDEIGEDAFVEVCKLAAGTKLKVHATVGRDGYQLKVVLKLPIAVNGKLIEDYFGLKWRIVEEAEKDESVQYY